MTPKGVLGAFLGPIGLRKVSKFLGSYPPQIIPPPSGRDFGRKKRRASFKGVYTDTYTTHNPDTVCHKELRNFEEMHGQLDFWHQIFPRKALQKTPTGMVNKAGPALGGVFSEDVVQNLQRAYVLPCRPLVVMTLTSVASPNIATFGIPCQNKESLG
eukprot:EG_transcript_21257